MGDVKVCRVCLVTGAKMMNLFSYPLENYLDTITGNSAFNCTNLPPFACYECGTLIKKYYQFREKCIKGRSILSNILQFSGKITEKEVKNVNRQNLQLCSNLTTHFITEDNAINYIFDDDSHLEIKTEDGGDDLSLKSFSIDVVENIKQEEFEDLNGDITSHLSSDDDNEPLSFHKNNKEKIAKQQNKKKEPNFLNVISDEVEKPEVLTTLQEIADIVFPYRRSKKTKRKKIGQEEINSKVTEKHNTKPGRPSRSRSIDAELRGSVDIIRLTMDEQIEEINKRQTSSNYLNAPFQCNLCYKGFINTDAWKNHVDKHDPKAGDIECAVCKFRFKNKRTLQKHASNHETKYKCKSCPYVSKTTTQAKQHQRWHKGVTYKCQYCDEVSTKWTSYLSHVRIKHPSEFICGICGYSFVSKLGLTMHKTMMHKDIVEKIADDAGKEGGCEAGAGGVGAEGGAGGGRAAGAGTGPYCAQCDVQFVSLEAHKRHMVTSAKHARSTSFSNGCRVCGETFDNGEELRIHHRKEHAKKRPKNYGKKPSNIDWPAKCEHCSEEIPNAREYWTHFRRIHPDKKYPIQKNYICDICGKGFRGNAFLVYHKRTHGEERPYKCSQCPKAFHNRTNLQMHLKTHSDNRPYPCTACFKAFKSKGALDRHFRSHTGVKPYVCEVCGKSFGQSNSRKLHVRTVHLRQPQPYVSRARAERRRAPAAAPAPPAPAPAPTAAAPPAYLYQPPA